MAEVNANATALDEFIEKQHYRLMWWRDANSALNYRRFFTITGLAGIRIEDERVFDQVFSLVKEWLNRGWVNGLRVDHIDGLRFPEEFLRRLGEEIMPSAWIVVEKILESGEALPPSWPIDGTTGYDFLSHLNSVFIDPQGENPLTEFYHEFTAKTRRIENADVVRHKKRSVLNNELAAETNRLTDLLVRISAEHWEVRDYARRDFARCLDRIPGEFASLVYRTYVTPRSNPEVRSGEALASFSVAVRFSLVGIKLVLLSEVFDFIEDLLLLRQRRGKLEE